MLIKGIRKCFRKKDLLKILREFPSEPLDFSDCKIHFLVQGFNFT